MTRRLDSLVEVAPRYGAVVFDQWGVLHDGAAASPRALSCLARLRASGARLAVLSNSGKRATANLARIGAMGIDPEWFEVVITSGEALWRDVAAGRIAARRLAPVERDAGDAVAWAAGLDVALTDDPTGAEAVLLLGLPDDATPERYAGLLDTAKRRDLPVLCANPDRASPRPNGAKVLSPGTLAHAYAAAGGDVRFYGKPWLPVFRDVEAALGLPPERLLMVGDSLEHDVAGAKRAGWDAAFLEGGLHAAAFGGADPPDVALATLLAAEGAPAPDFTLPELG